MMLSICFLDRATLASSIEFKRPSFKHRWIEYANTAAADTAARLKDSHIAITNKVVIDEAILDQCPKLKYIAVAATGANVVDLEACRQRGIVVANVTDYATHAVAEHVFMFILALSKQLKPYSQALVDGQWQANNQFCFFLEPIQTLHHKTLGLIGTGSIAKATAKLARAFGMQVIFYSPSGRKRVDEYICVSLDRLLAASDVVSIHCPLTSQTQKLISTTEFNKMKSTALLINTARGPIVNIDALLVALNSKIIAGAGLDVLPEEPPAKNSPIMAALNCSNLLITPHTAWASHSAMQTLANQLIHKMEDFAAGKPVINLADE
jgi:glycerate dehydrogenase